MRHPTIHLNGTARAALEEAFQEARNAVIEAIGMVARCAPNARDYYPQGPSAFSEAVREHAARLRALSKLNEELAALAAHAADAPQGSTGEVCATCGDAAHAAQHCPGNRS